MDTNLLHKGIVTYFSAEKHFGFLDTELHESIFFFIDTSKSKTEFSRGDEVFFKLKPSDKNDGTLQAYDLKFIKNEKINQLQELIEDNEPLPGYLKKIGEEYFIKDKATYLFIPLQISIWEENLEEFINDIMLYKVIKNSHKINKIKAVLYDRVYTKTWHTLNNYKKNNRRLTAKIAGKNKYGYFATIPVLNDIVVAFLPFKKDGSVPETLRKQDTVEVKISAVYDNSINVQLAGKKFVWNKMYQPISKILMLLICAGLFVGYGWSAYATITERSGLNGNMYSYYQLTKLQYSIYNGLVSIFGLVFGLMVFANLFMKNKREIKRMIKFFLIFLIVIIICELCLNTRFQGKG
jgi:cold shock CspA family protein